LPNLRICSSASWLAPSPTAVFPARVGRPCQHPYVFLTAEFLRSGVVNSFGRPTIFKIHDDLYAWMVNHEYGFQGIDAQQVSDATIRARQELHRLVDALRSLGDPWKNVKIVATASQIGVREGRRVHGRHTVSVQDMLDGARYPDAVCRVTFGIDVHSTSRQHSTGIESHAAPRRTQAYDIPLRALIAKDADGLLMAGRCISGDFLAHSSYRVTGNAVAMGEAAGITASLAAAQGRLPHEIAWDDIAEKLARKTS
ncbi:MAG: FAD-dependent oxidoreductase, partial [Planctomycetes bacterium]|nr:FAD-dependent oxidoreductase [Planctomycetota bacterium]